MVGRLRRGTRPAGRQQKHCGTMDLTPQGRRHVNLRRIRIRCVRGITKVLGATETAIMNILCNLGPFANQARLPGSKLLFKSLKMTLKIEALFLFRDLSNSG